MSIVIGAIVVALHVTAIVVAFRAIRTSRTPQGAMGWVIFLLTLPYLALPVFLYLGHSRFPGYISIRRTSRIAVSDLANLPGAVPGTGDTPGGHVGGFERIAGMPVVSGNAARLLVDGEETFGAMMGAIEAAQSYVLVQFYIVRDDELGRAFKDLLIRKAGQGCTVRLLYDRIGSYNLPDAYLAELRAAGVACADFHSIRQPHSRFQINFRNHRKIAIVDGEVGFLGGLNLGDEYMGRDPGFGRWRDTHLRVEGPVVAQMQLVFAEDWKWATEERLELHWRPDRQTEDMRALVIAPGPSDALETGSLYFCNAISAARHRIWIASPYLVPDGDIQTALTLAAMRGVDVRILVSAKRDHLWVWLAAFAYFDDLRRAGIKIYRYGDGFMHQKVVLVDDALASVGTLNLDNRSCRLNFEVTALILDAGFATDVEAMLEADFARSDPYVTALDDSPSRLRRYGAPVARLLAPLL